MSVRKLVTVVMLLEIFGNSASINAQAVPSGNKSIGERLDDVGQSIFGIFSSDAKDKNKDKVQHGKTDPRTSSSAKQDSQQIFGNYSQSQGSKSTNSSNVYQPKPVTDPVSRQARVFRSDGMASSPSASSSDNLPGRRYFEDAKIQDEGNTPENTPLSQARPAQQQRVVTTSKKSTGSSESATQDDLTSKPLHEQFNQFRRSAFDHTPKSVSVDDSTKKEADPPTKTETKSSDKPQTSSPSFSEKEEMFAPMQSQPKPAELLSADGESSQPAASKQVEIKKTGRPTPAKRPAGMAIPERQSVVEDITPAKPVESDVAAEEMALPTREPVRVPVKTITKETKKIASRVETPSVNDNGMLFARKSPILSVETHGSRKISVGKESAYEVKIINSGEVAAEDLTVFVNLPEWADVVSAESTIGAPQVTTPGQTSAPFQWKVGNLQAKSQEKLVLRIVPRQSRPFDLAVRWDYKPVTSQTMIEVQEPKLEMQLEGPREVFYGKKETYRLKLLNTGSGNAESVVIKFLPVGTGENVPANYELGLLPAGEEKLIEIELTARQSGMLEIQVQAKGDAGVHAELAERVLVRRAGLEIAMDGPKLQFIGTTASYSVRVRNPGNAPAKNVGFSVALPAGLKYIGGIEGARIEASSNKLHWTADTINPDTMQNFIFKCIPNAAGVSRLEITASADADLAASAAAVTQVESIANLAIDVKDPSGPIPVGEEAVYEITVRNRGTKDAEGIEVLGYFSRGIEPTGAEGGPNRVSSGAVAFAPIPALAAGAKIVLKIHARAEEPGNHIFRAELQCKVLGSRLISEKTTLYYQDAPAESQTLQARPPDKQVVR